MEASNRLETEPDSDRHGTHESVVHLKEFIGARLKTNIKPKA